MPMCDVIEINGVEVERADGTCWCPLDQKYGDDPERTVALAELGALIAEALTRGPVTVTTDRPVA